MATRRPIKVTLFYDGSNVYALDIVTQVELEDPNNEDRLFTSQEKDHVPDSDFQPGEGPAISALGSVILDMMERRSPLVKSYRRRRPRTYPCP